jgi:hypothetical protein
MDTHSFLLSGLVTSTLRGKLSDIAPFTSQPTSPIKPKPAHLFPRKASQSIKKRRAKRCTSCDNEEYFPIEKTNISRIADFSKTISPAVWPKAAMEVSRPVSDFAFTQILRRQQVFTYRERSRRLYAAQRLTTTGREGSEMLGLRISGKRTRLAVRKLSPQPLVRSPAGQRRVRTFLPDISVGAWEA